VSNETHHDKRPSLDGSEVPSTAGKQKVSKVAPKRSSAPFLGVPTTPVANAAKGSAKKVAGVAKVATQSPDVEDSGGRKAGGRACGKEVCVRNGSKPRCFAGAAPR